MPETKFNVPWKRGDALAVFLASWIGLPLLLFALIQFWGTFSSPVADFIRALEQEKIGAAFIFLVADSLAAFGIVHLFLKKYGASLGDVGLRGFKPLKALGWMVLTFLSFAVIMFWLFELLSLFVPGFNADQPQVNEFTTNAGRNLSLSLAALVLVPPFIEEIVFRGFIFPAYSDRYGPVAGAVVSSLLFGLAHWQLNVSIYTFVLGLLLCMMYYKLRSIWPGIVYHMINNLIAFSLILNQ